MRRSLTVLLLLILCTLISAQEWQVIEVDEGVKPAIVVNSMGSPEISYMLESQAGWVRHAVWDQLTAEFQIEAVHFGYFYGPLDVVLDQNDEPHISFHDHGTEDQIHSYRDGVFWNNDNISSPGHDGWDNRIVIDSNNNPHTSTVDPGATGVEYAWYDGSDWTVEPIGSGNVPYQWATSLALDGDDNPHITYFDPDSEDLMYATKEDGGWNITSIDSDGRVGRFSDLVLDANDNPHISYYEHFGQTLDQQGHIKYMYFDGDSWSNQIIDTLNAVSLQFIGARNITSIVLNSIGNPTISYADAEYVYYAVNDGLGNWSIETVIDQTDQTDPLGQITSLGLSANDQPHIATFRQTQPSPLQGVVLYATRQPLVSINDDGAPPGDFGLEQNYPNPFNPSTVIGYQVPANSQAKLSVYDVSGRLVRTLVDRQLTTDTRLRAVWDGIDDQGKPVASGVYFYQLTSKQINGSTNQRINEVRKMILMR